MQWLTDNEIEGVMNQLLLSRVSLSQGYRNYVYLLTRLKDSISNNSESFSTIKDVTRKMG